MEILTSILYAIIFFTFLIFMQISVQGKKPASGSSDEISSEVRQGQKSSKKKKKRKKSVKRDDVLQSSERKGKEIEVNEETKSSGLNNDEKRPDIVVVELACSNKRTDERNISPPPFTPDMRVEGFWEESGDWYPAVITKVHRSGRISLKFDDGEVKENMEANHVRSLALNMSAREGGKKAGGGAVVTELPDKPRTKNTSNEREDDGWQLVDAPKAPQQAAVDRQLGREDKSVNLRNRKKRERKREKEREIREIQRRSVA